MKDLFEAIYGEQRGKACIVRNDVHGVPTVNKFFSYPDDLDAIVAYCEKHSHENVYFTPTLWSANKRTKPVAHALTTAFGDADLFHVDDAKVEPSIIVRTSPTKTHLYWLLTDCNDPIKVEELNHGISEAHPKDETGFDVGWNMTKLLRVPGTSNLKYATPFTVTWEHTGSLYSYAEMASHYPPVTTGTVHYRDMGEIPKRSEAMQNISWSSTIDDILESRFMVGKGSEAIWFAILELMRAGASDEDCFAIIHDQPIDKWSRDGHKDAAERLWADIQRARAKEGETLENQEVVHVSPMHVDLKYDFLSDEEKDGLEGTWVDDFVAWSGSKTNASKDFQVASAFTALSTVLSDFGYMPTGWDETPLNLWFMVLGRTTLDRKSTVKGHMMKVLDRLSDGEEYTYDLGSDFTIEALTGVMLDSPNRSGILVRDEIQSFLRELEAKSYMSGTKGTLTDIYGGRVNGKLRAGGDQKRKKAVKFALSFYAMGIQEQVADALNADDFGSGFLTRFIWVEPTDIETRSSDFNDGFRQVAKSKIDGDDMAFYDLVNSLQNARDYYAGFVSGLDDEAMPIPHTDEAWDRLAKFRQDMMTAAEQTGHANVMAPSDRLSHNVGKCATLLAMSQGKDEVQVSHVVSAINYCNTWFSNMLKMATKVSESGWKRQQDEVLAALVEAGGEISYRKLYAKFRATIKVRDYTDVMTALVESGIVALEGGGDKRVVKHIGGGAVVKA